MAKTDWTLIDEVKPEDMNQIGQEINQLREDVDNIEVPPASTTQTGIVQLSNDVDSTSEILAATPKAVKTAYDHAEAAFQLGNERKQEVVDVLIAKGVSASTSESWDSLIGKLSSIIKATGSAAVGDVLVNKTFSNATANGLTGTMPDRGAINATLTQQGQEYTIPNGRHSGTGKVTANITNLTAANVRNGATVGGIAGTFSQFSNGATAAQILTGRSAAVNGATVNGTMANRTGFVTGQSVSRNGTMLRIRPQAGYYPGDTGNGVQFSDANFVASNIRRGVTLFGLAGTYSSTPIYDTGNDYVNFQRSPDSAGVGTFTKQAQDLYLGHSSSHGLNVTSANLIDVTGYSFVVCLYRGGADRSVSIDISTEKDGSSTAYGQLLNVYGSFTAHGVDLSGITGSYYIRLRIGGITTGTMRELWVRKIYLA